MTVIRAARVVHPGKEKAHGITDPQDVRLARRVRRTSADWGETEIASGDLTDAITCLKQQRSSDGYLLAQGGTRFARSLVETGLIDEYRLVIHPVVLGADERLFTAPLTIESMSTIAFSGGAVAHVVAAHP